MLPIYYLADSAIVGVQMLSENLSSGTVKIPPPHASVAEWPLIGEKVFSVWSGAASNLEATLNSFEPQLRTTGEALVKIAGSSALGVLQFALAFIIAGAFLVSAHSGYRVARAFAKKLSPDNGEALIDMSIATVRSVAKGVLGVAVIQALMSAIGLAIIGAPAAGLWSFLILILAIMQLPPMLILGPIAVWAFSVVDGTTATIFAIYTVLISASDSILKPMLLGRGLDIPMLVILLGAIGGLMLSGIIGLFIGAVILAVGYKILMSWMDAEQGTGATSAPSTF
jgi:predicted PurR-regulated permease PerM